MREYDRKKALKDEFSFLTREKRRVPTRKPYSRVFRRSCRQKQKRPKTLKRYSANLQRRKNTFTLYTIFRGYRERFPLVLFRNNGEPLTFLASKALCAVGENELSLIAEKEFSMYDENNEEVSVDKDEIENLDGEFKAKLQKQQVLNSIKTYIIKNIDMLS